MDTADCTFVQSQITLSRNAKVADQAHEQLSTSLDKKNIMSS